MTLDVFLNFNGNCRQAVEFYAQMFGLPVPEFMTYGDAPAGEFPLDERDKERIMYASLPIGGSNTMLADWPTNGSEAFVSGNNYGLTISSGDPAEIERLYNALKEGGTIEMELQKTFWSEMYAMITDKFGTLWQLSLGSL